jgi:uncharacterized protein
MQLGQPIQASHPLDSGLSILDYLMRNYATIPDDRGVFLNTSYRMHSKVNHFISHAIYEGKLNAYRDNDRRVILPPAEDSIIPYEAGIQVIDVPHEGNTQASDEEVAKVVEISEALLGRTLVDKDEERKLCIEDILFVAPYNHQVNKLKAALGPNAKVGSIDKFQGQEAPVVILSMCTSDPNDSPRGLEFLFDKQRLNVAISRAQCLAIVVASPELKHAQAQNIKQQALINTYARLCHGAD